MKHRKLLSVLLALALLLALLPAAALAEGQPTPGGDSAEHPYEPADWEALNATLRALAGGGMFYVRLTRDLYPTWDSLKPVAEKYEEYWNAEEEEDAYWTYYLEADTAAALNVMDGTSVTLDLNGHVISSGLTEEDAERYAEDYITGFYAAVSVSGSLTVADSSDGDGLISGGVYIDAAGRFTLAGGAVSDSFYGVSVEGGSFTMTGGVITGNDEYGVEVYDGSFAMSGGEISDNDSGGVDVYGGSFTMTGGVIRGNRWEGVKAESAALTVSGGEISENGSVGIAAVDSDLVLAAGLICHNEGTGVIADGGSFAMSGGGILSNGYAMLEDEDAVEAGGPAYYTVAGFGVVLEDSDVIGEGAAFTMTGGEIRGNGYPDPTKYDAAFFSRSGHGKEPLDAAEFLPSSGYYFYNSAGVTVGDGSTFTMRDGLISGNGAYGVFVRGGDPDEERPAAAFTMTGGEVSGNGAGYYSPASDAPEQIGTGVYVSTGGAVILSGGGVSDHSDCGVELSGGALAMSGGEVRGNGVGVLAAGESEVELSGGRIADNTAEGAAQGLSNQWGSLMFVGWTPAQFRGAGVVFDANTAALTVSGGEIAGNDRGVVAVSASHLPIKETDWVSDAGEASGGPVISGGRLGGNTDADVVLVTATVRLDASASPQLEASRAGLSEYMDEIEPGVFALRTEPTAPVIRVGAPLGERVLRVSSLRKLNTFIAGAGENGSVELSEEDSAIGGVVTSGLSGNGGAANFLSAMEGYVVALDTDLNEIVLTEGTVTLTVTKGDAVLSDGDTVDLVAGGTLRLTATVEPADANRNVLWTSRDESVVTVSDGMLRAVGAGTTTLTVAADGGAKLTLKVTVKAGEGEQIQAPGNTVADNIITPKTTVKDGVATVSRITADDIKKALSAGKDPIVIDVSATGADTLILPSGFAKLFTATAPDSSLQIVLATGSLTFDSKAMAALTAMGDGEELFRLAGKEPELTDAQRQALRGREVRTLFDTNVTVNGKTVTSFGDGSVKVALPLAPREGQAGRDHRVWYVAEEGAMEPRPSSYENEELTVTLTHNSVYAVIYEPMPFTDVDYESWYGQPVVWATVHRVTNGKGSETTFLPGDTVTRAEAATFLYRLAGEPDAAGNAAAFADVEPGAWYAPAVAWAAANGVAEGWTDAATGAQVFAPDEFVTREQFAAMLYRYAKLHGQGFAEGLWSFRLEFPDAADVSDWAVEAVSWMVMQGVVNGVDGKLVPQGSSTRAQIVTMVYRYAILEE